MAGRERRKSWDELASIPVMIVRAKEVEKSRKLVVRVMGDGSFLWEIQRAIGTTKMGDKVLPVFYDREQNQKDSEFMKLSDREMIFIKNYMAILLSEGVEAARNFCQMTLKKDYPDFIHKSKRDGKDVFRRFIFEGLEGKQIGIKVAFLEKTGKEKGDWTGVSIITRSPENILYLKELLVALCQEMITRRIQKAIAKQAMEEVLDSAMIEEEKVDETEEKKVRSGKEQIEEVEEAEEIEETVEETAEEVEGVEESIEEGEGVEENVENAEDEVEAENEEEAEKKEVPSQKGGQKGKYRKGSGYGGGGYGTYYSRGRGSSKKIKR